MNINCKIAPRMIPAGFRNFKRNSWISNDAPNPNITKKNKISDVIDHQFQASESIMYTVGATQKPQKTHYLHDGQLHGCTR